MRWILLVSALIGLISLYSFRSGKDPFLLNSWSSLDKKVTVHSVLADEVYLCKSSGAIAYHSTLRCRGLAACTHTIIEVSVKEAINDYGRRACKLCY